MFIMKADAAHPGKFDFTYNVEQVLKDTVPEGKGWYIENQAEKDGGGAGTGAGTYRDRYSTAHRYGRRVDGGAEPKRAFASSSATPLGTAIFPRQGRYLRHGPDLPPDLPRL